MRLSSAGSPAGRPAKKPRSSSRPSAAISRRGCGPPSRERSAPRARSRVPWHTEQTRGDQETLDQAAGCARLSLRSERSTGGDGVCRRLTDSCTLRPAPAGAQRHPPLKPARHGARCRARGEVQRPVRGTSRADPRGSPAAYIDSRRPPESPRPAPRLPRSSCPDREPGVATSTSDRTPRPWQAGQAAVGVEREGFGAGVLETRAAHRADDLHALGSRPTARRKWPFGHWLRAPAATSSAAAR